MLWICDNLFIYLKGLLQIACNFELQILPNGDAWIPSMVKEIVGIATNGKKSLLVDEKLVNGSESNDRGKIFIPLILGVQVKTYLTQVFYLRQNWCIWSMLFDFCFFILQWLLVKWIQREIKKDIVKGGKYIWVLLGCVQVICKFSCGSLMASSSLFFYLFLSITFYVLAPSLFLCLCREFFF